MSDQTTTAQEEVKENIENTESTSTVTTKQEVPDYINVLIGDSGKYKDEKELAKGYVNLEKHAKLLEEENRLFREKIQKFEEENKTIDTILNAINKKEDFSMEDQNTQDIDALVRKALEEKEKIEREKQLRQKAKDIILQAFDNDQEKANKAMYNYVAGDPNKDRLVKELSVTDPEGLVKLIKPEESLDKTTQTSFNPTTSKSVNMTTQTDSEGMLTWSKAKKVLLEDPKTYYSKSFRNKLNESIAKAEQLNINFYET